MQRAENVITELRCKGFNDKRICKHLNRSDISPPFDRPEWTYVLLRRFENHNHLLDRLAKVSGPLPQTHGGIDEDILYGSFHYAGLDHAKSWRNTLQRFDQFQIPQDLSGMTVLDMGSNTGAMSFEFARRGAKVTGLEFNQERVDICNELARHLDVDATFHQVDFDTGIPSCFYQYDIVVCTAVDAYVKDRFKLYDFIIGAAKNICYLESNFPTLEEMDIMHHFYRKFHVQYKGRKDHRRVFVLLSKKLSESELIDGWHVRKFKQQWDWEKLKRIYEKIHDIPQCVEMDFSKPLYIKSRHIEGRRLSKWLPEGNRKRSLRDQMISFLSQLAQRAVAHRDLHRCNTIVDSQNRLFVIDWEWATENEHMYDITGIGEVPYHGFKQTIFCDSVKRHSIASVLDIKQEDIVT